MTSAKRFQIFLSSTFVDLQSERNACVTSLLRLGAIPMGMELFPASDKAQWEIIKSSIPQCDYYVLLTAGRYGSLQSEVSYTEAEYDLAISLGVPVIPFLHKTPNQLFEQAANEPPEFLDRLLAFRAKLERSHTCQYWDNPTELTALLFQSVTDAFTRIERPGWIRGTDAVTEDALRQIIALQAENKVLLAEIAELRANQTYARDDLANGEDKIVVQGRFRHESQRSFFRREWKREISWNEIIRAFVPEIQTWTNQAKINNTLSRIFDFDEESRSFANRSPKDDMVRVNDEDVTRILLQLEALGVIEAGVFKLQAGGQGKFWQATALGNALLRDMMVVPKKS